MCQQSERQNQTDNMETTKAFATNGQSHNESITKDEQVDHLPWWCGGGVIPKSGKDFGIMEKSLEDRANCLSLWSLSYLNPLLGLGSRKVLDEGDVGIPSEQDQAERAFQGASVAWIDQLEKAKKHNDKLRASYEAALTRCTSEEQRNKIREPKWKEPSIASSLVTSFGGWRITVALLFYIISAMLSFVPVLILNDLVKYFEHYARFGDEVPYEGLANPWVLVAGLGVIPVLMSILQTRHQTIMAHCGVFVRTAVSTLLYQKSLKVSAAGRAKTSTGQVVNMMSNDTMQLQRFLQFVGLTMVAPIQIVVALFLIYQQVSEQGFTSFFQKRNFLIHLGPRPSLRIILSGRKRHMGRCRIHGFFGSH